jgi:hypothetical protein
MNTVVLAKLILIASVLIGVFIQVILFTTSLAVTDPTIGHNEEIDWLSSHNSSNNSNNSNNNNTTSPNKQEPQGFAACLIYQDDNTYLIEWLAYHYHFLPLRRLIVGIDPKSRTLPTEILDRYRSRNLLQITEWTDKDYFPAAKHEAHIRKMLYQQNNLTATTISSSSQAEKLLEDHVLFSTYLKRQQWFYTACMTQFIKEKQSWTILIDTDEIVVPNWRAHKEYRIRQRKPTVLEMLQSPENRDMFHSDHSLSSSSSSSPLLPPICISMHRMNMGTKMETNNNSMAAARYEYMLPKGFRAEDLFTFRFRWHGDVAETPLAGKCMMDLSRVRVDATNFRIRPNFVSPHRPLEHYCSKRDKWIPHHMSPFVIYQYIGTWEQWSYREDSRNLRTKELYDTHAYSFGADDGARFWLQEFVEEHSYDLASELLKGAGQVGPN